MVENQYLDHVVDLLSSKEIYIKLNAIQLVANLAEHPKGREKFLQPDVLAKIKALRDDKTFVEFIEVVDQTLSVINMIPWDLNYNYLNFNLS